MNRCLTRLCIGLVTLLGLLASAVSAPAAPRLTIVDGEATVIDGDRALAAAEGLSLGAEALLRTGAKTTLVRIEWPDGSVADLGPDTQVMIEPGGFGGRGRPTPALYLLRGWVKAAAMGAQPAPGLLTARLDVQPFKGALVVMVAGTETWAFAESGAVSLGERELTPASTAALKNGEVYSRDGNAKGAVAPRPTPAQMQRVPRGFRDPLPLRLQTFKDRSVTPRTLAPPTHAELQPWLTAEKPLRRNFTKRFAKLAREATFRAALASQLGQHPEWEPVLFPERFVKPKAASQ